MTDNLCNALLFKTLVKQNSSKILKLAPNDWDTIGCTEWRPQNLNGLFSAGASCPARGLGPCSSSLNKGPVPWGHCSSPWWRPLVVTGTAADTVLTCASEVSASRGSRAPSKRPCSPLEGEVSIRRTAPAAVGDKPQQHWHPLA